MIRFIPSSLIFGLVLCAGFGRLAAQETACARVFIEIRQEVALARQAFEARMGITNALPGELTDIQVTLLFADEDGNPVPGVTTTVADPDAYFFFRPDLSEGGTVSTPHPSSVPAGTTRRRTWTIIPTLTAANAGENPSAAGTIYRVGAELRYIHAGKVETVDIQPDFIRVKPLPEIQLDYFLPYDVSGDDPMTPIVEPPVPFALALRARNVGIGTARSLTLESTPPRITRNDLGAPVQFSINGVRLNDNAILPSLLVDAGDLVSGQSAMVRWEMRSRLSGRFTEFTSEVFHGDELGGALTALLRQPETHRLEGEVLVDLPGRDRVVDILAFDSMTSDASPLRVYESQPVDIGNPAALDPVLVPTANINLSGVVSGGVLALGNPTPAGESFCYVKAPDPWLGTRSIKRAVRSDGRVVTAPNTWLSRRYAPPAPGAPPVTEFFVHLFDWLPAGSGAVAWTLDFEEAGLSNRPPVIGALASRIVKHGEPLSFSVSAVDPDGQIVALSLPVRPFGSTFTGDNDGTAVFSWTPGGQGVPQTGDFPLTFTASDGIATTSRTILLTITEDELLDAWKSRWWAPDDPLSANFADPDADGLLNLYEYALDLDPTRSSTHQRPVLTRVEQDGKHYLALTALYRTDDERLQVDAVTAGDPDEPEAGWTPAAAGVTVDAEATPPGFRRARFQDTVAIEDSPTSARFIRLRVRLLP